MILFYHLFLWFYRLGVFLASFVNPKARLFIKGRVNVFAKIKKDMKHLQDKKTIWMHCASLGEFEQGKPVLKRLLDNNPEIVPVISFFSPSGYEIIKKKNEFPYIYYLPMDSFVNARHWLRLIKPSLVLWVKYEYWYFYLMAIRRKKIPLIMVSGIYDRGQIFFKWYAGIYRKMLLPFTHFFVQNRSSRSYLSTLIEKSRITVSGDTRCDRVLEVANNFRPIPEIEKFIGEHRVVVCGSTWEADEAIWVHYVNSHPDMRFIIAPHQIDKENVQFVKSRFRNSITYTDWLQQHDQSQISTAQNNCLIIDNIGMLSRLYYYADLAYVGGGFGASGLHNILEAAVYGKPVLFGPYIKKNFEAQQLIDAGGGRTVATALELEDVVREWFSNPGILKEKSEQAKQYVLKNAGASRMIVDYIEKEQLI